MEFQKPDNTPRFEPEIVDRKEIAKKREAKRSGSRAMQNVISVLSQ